MHPMIDPPPLPVITKTTPSVSPIPEALITEDSNPVPDDPITTEDGNVLTTE